MHCAFDRLDATAERIPIIFLRFFGFFRTRMGPKVNFDDFWWNHHKGQGILWWFGKRFAVIQEIITFGIDIYRQFPSWDSISGFRCSCEQFRWLVGSPKVFFKWPQQVSLEVPTVAGKWRRGWLPGRHGRKSATTDLRVLWIASTLSLSLFRRGLEFERPVYPGSTLLPFLLWRKRKNSQLWPLLQRWLHPTFFLSYFSWGYSQSHLGRHFRMLFQSSNRPTQSIMYVPLQENRYQINVLLILQYKYLKLCSGDFNSSESETNKHTNNWSSAQDHAKLILLLNIVGFSIFIWPRWSAGNVLYHSCTSFEGASRGGQPLNIFTWFVGVGGLKARNLFSLKRGKRDVRALSFELSKMSPLRWGWVFRERTRILSGIKFTTHFIDFFFVETKRFVSSFVNVILTRQTCGQRSRAGLRKANAER